MSQNSFFLCVCHITVSLHVPLCHLECHCYFASSFDSGNLSSLCFRYDFWVVYGQTLCLFVWAEEFCTPVIFNRLEHSDLLLNNSRLEWNMSTSIRFTVFFSTCIYSSAVDHHLRPSMRIHRSVLYFEWQVPNDVMWWWMTIRALKCMLTSTLFVSACLFPVSSRYEIVFHS